MTKVAYAHSQEGLASERIAKIRTDTAVAHDKIRRAHNEDTSSLLNIVRAIKELEGMDITNMERKLNILEKISPSVNPEENVVENNVV